MKVIVFAGGVGSRLWPLSRKNSPKQFGKIIEDRSMLQIAVHKLFPEFTWNDVYISTGVKYKDTIAKQLPELPKENLIVEPEMRDVGPAVGLVIARLVKTHPNEPICLLWGSDHLVKNEKTIDCPLQMLPEPLRLPAPHYLTGRDCQFRPVCSIQMFPGRGYRALLLPRFHPHRPA